jgi:hypothetical protein
MAYGHTHTHIHTVPLQYFALVGCMCQNIIEYVNQSRVVTFQIMEYTHVLFVHSENVYWAL